MTLGVTGVVWLPRTATVNSTTLMAGGGAAPLAAASAAWQSVAASYADASITVGRVMALLAAGWEGEAANAAQARLGGFLAWTQGTSARAAQVAALAGGEAAAYTTAAVVMPSLPEIIAVKAAKTAAYTSGGALNGSAEAMEVADRAMDVRAGLVMEAYEAATTPLAWNVSFDRPPTIVNGDSSGAGSDIADAESTEETSIFGFGARTTPAQAALAAVGSALQNPALASAAGQVASTAGSVAGSSVTTVASAATNIGSAAASNLMNSGNPQSQGSVSPHLGSPMSGGAAAPASTRAVSAGVLSGGGGVGGGGFGSPASGSGKLGSPMSGSPGAQGLSGAERAGTATNPSPMLGAQTDGATASRGAQPGSPGGGTHGGANHGGANHSGNDEVEHETPGYLRQFEHFADGRTVAPSVIGADPNWNK
ncbi:PPE domain-containing protein [Rhodococcus sp. G-MC3]|uniref:PPE domain-containing protein n=1 Tax=Rhodococcus sp. G-MC3 TaxID=3046209 RepID=UPI0024BB1EDB|nr:PPE domain-containing protein [Rhodococcus sp. G-MC3]MDJ0394336.1 PPE domain-containing protein [Rhodococcus sp. G-MC3]